MPYLHPLHPLIYSDQCHKCSSYRDNIINEICGWLCMVQFMPSIFSKKNPKKRDKKGCREWRQQKEKINFS